MNLYFPSAEGVSRILLIPGGWRTVHYCAKCDKPRISERTERRWKHGRVKLGRCKCDLIYVHRRPK